MSDQDQDQDEQNRIVGILLDAEKLYDAVLARLKIDHSDELYTTLILNMLKRQTRDHLILSIWSNLDEAQNRHLREFMNQTAITEPGISHEDLLLEFAMMYPALMEKVNKGLTEFFKNFIAKFNEISEA